MQRTERTRVLHHSTEAGGLTLSRSRRPFRTAYLRFILIEHRYSLHSDRYARCMTCMNQCFVLFAGSEQSMYNDAQSRLANIIYSSDRTGRLWWVTEQNKNGAKRGCAVLEGRSTRLSFFFFVLCLSYHFKWQNASNLFIFSLLHFSLLTARC